MLCYGLYNIGKDWWIISFPADIQPPEDIANADSYSLSKVNRRLSGRKKALRSPVNIVIHHGNLQHFMLTSSSVVGFILQGDMPPSQIVKSTKASLNNHGTLYLFGQETCLTYTPLRVFGVLSSRRWETPGLTSWRVLLKATWVCLIPQSRRLITFIDATFISMSSAITAWTK